jgi:hypothetical protein
MPLDINTSIDFLKTRVDQTLSVQRSIADTWTWDLKTLAEWEADSLQLDKTQPNTVAAKAIAAATRADSARGALDGRLAELHAQTLTTVGVMRVRAERAPEHRDVVNELSARGDSRRAIEDEATALLSAWTEEFGENFAPAPGITYDGFKALLFGDAAATPPSSSLRTLKQALSDAATVARRETGRLSVLLNRVETDAQQWYAEATSVFKAGTEIGDLIRSGISSSDSYSPEAPKPEATPAAPPA